MFLDGRKLDAGDILEADVCIIGAGAAAIPIALAFADTPVRVAMLESGGLASSPGDRRIYRVVIGSRAGVGVDRRLWHFGGNTNHWFGNCRPLDDDDFAVRDWIPHSGWPIARDELRRFYDEAQRLCGLGDFAAYDLETCRPWLSHPPLALRSDALETRVMQIASALRFGDLHYERLEAARNVRIYLHTRALTLQTNRPGDAVDGVVAVSATGRRFFVSPAVTILAAGGIENARLLLCSDRPNRRGLGNEHDVVGRYFMEHPFIDVSLGRWRTAEDLNSEPQAAGNASVWGADRTLGAADATRALARPEPLAPAGIIACTGSRARGPRSRSRARQRAPTDDRRRDAKRGERSDGDHGRRGTSHRGAIALSDTSRGVQPESRPRAGARARQSCSARL